ncbi:hypothetical protein M406DRAFT_331770 [Cryphonectria parasitica EP155]|uniref:Uncharacterized protein n=1 Tax=Cryphonectria parasitica (strain ATCC 38755 / EP155) TaxID=660469 RepID=A0A9P5CMG4_CRYP1|nr:uncharacterized protein M406DRAFT_331770 [Cryphonectria parasitica EP155]KAF3763232.1 hypothetical protein M406DRAFT_331770 [Cryphonectria parasitica EP155]
MPAYDAELVHFSREAKFCELERFSSGSRSVEKQPALTGDGQYATKSEAADSEGDVKRDNDNYTTESDVVARGREGDTGDGQQEPQQPQQQDRHLELAYFAQRREEDELDALLDEAYEWCEEDTYVLAAGPDEELHELDGWLLRGKDEEPRTDLLCSESSCHFSNIGGGGRRGGGEQEGSKPKSDRWNSEGPKDIGGLVRGCMNALIAPNAPCDAQIRGKSCSSGSGGVVED